MKRNCNASISRLVIGLLVMLSVSLSSACIGGVQAQSDVMAQLPDDEHGVFRPSTHGFTVKNAKLSERIVQRFKLKGEDAPVSVAEKEFLLWELFEPRDLCMGSQDEEDCPIKPAAIKWIDNQIKSMANGVCEGMIVATLAFWKAQQEEEDLLAESLLDFDLDSYLEAEDNNPGYVEEEDWVEDYSLRAVEEEEWVEDVVMYGFTSQLVDSVALAAAASRKEAPSALHKKIYNSIASYEKGIRGPDVQLYTIGMYRVVKGDLKKGHSVMPYKVTDEGKGVFRVYVYDANHPNDDTLYIEFNGDRWTYGPQKLSDDTPGRLELTPWLVRNFHKERYFACPYCAPPNPLKAPTEVWLAGEGELTIRNTAGVILAGYDSDNDKYVESSAVNQTPFKGGLDEDVPDLYQLPASETGYQITAYDPFKFNETGETTDLVLSNAGISVFIEELDLAQMAQNALTVSVKNTAAGPLVWIRIDGGQSGVSIPSVVLVEDSDEASYEFELIDVQAPAGTRLAIGLAKRDHRLIFSPFSTGTGDPADLRPYHLVAARLDDQFNEYELEVPEVLVASQETVVFDFKKLEAASLEVEAEDLPITIWADVNIERMMAQAVENPNQDRQIQEKRVMKNGKGRETNRKRVKKTRRRRMP